VLQPESIAINSNSAEQRAVFFITYLRFKIFGREFGRGECLGPIVSGSMGELVLLRGNADYMGNDFGSIGNELCRGPYTSFEQRAGSCEQAVYSPLVAHRFGPCDDHTINDVGERHLQPLVDAVLGLQ
jgi:hypothetical protein